MSRISINRTVDASSPEVWEILADFGGVHRFHPLVERSPLLSDNNSGVGATRRCEFYDGKSITERVIDWTEGRSMRVAIIEGDMPMDEAVAELSVRPIEGGRSEVTMTMEYEPSFGFAGKIMDKLMMRFMFKNMCGKVLDGLDTHARTGSSIGKKGKPLAQTVAA